MTAKYPSISIPTAELNSLMVTVMELRQAVTLLTLNVPLRVTTEKPSTSQAPPAKLPPAKK